MGEGKAVVGVLDEVEAAQRALSELGYTVSSVPLRPPIERVRERLECLETDLVLNLFEGFDGCPQTESAVAGLLSEIGLRYTGSPAAALSLALDKPRAKALLESAGINSPRYQVLTVNTLSRFDLGFPCIVKPCTEDGSHGITHDSVVNDLTSLEEQVGRVSRLFGGKALVEEFVDGREFNATVLGASEPIVLPISEIVYCLPPGMPRILTFSAKWQPLSTEFRGSRTICPAEMGSDLRQNIAEAAVSVFSLIGCRGYARVDFRVNDGVRANVIEVNPNPDISPKSGAARQAEAAGMTYNQFIERVVLLARDMVS